MDKKLNYSDFELDCLEKEIKDICNNELKICCEKCHSQDYTVYPTGYIPEDMIGYEYFSQFNDIWYICKGCGYVWASGFCKKEKKAT